MNLKKSIEEKKRVKSVSVNTIQISKLKELLNCGLSDAIRILIEIVEDNKKLRDRYRVR
jgi:hypothetical protein